ncbi:MAG: hypothetical protein U9Q05_13850 [Thermodesulfobacteriota bacterium]|nr:hypothetical protein [Thermodesulfobacteriota bacterium]
MPANQLNSMNFDDFLGTIFRISDLSAETDQPEFALNIDMVRVLVSLDGKTSIKNIARDMKVPGEQLHGSVEKLIEMRLIEALESRSKVLDQDFFNSLSTTMARMVGPIAPILIDDAVADLGHERSIFPIQRVAELVDALSVEIQQKDKRLAFQKGMMQMLKEKGYLNL